MRLDLDTDMRFPDGGRAGTLRRVVVDENNDVTQVVMATEGFVSRDVIVPMEALAEGEGGVLNINLTPDQIDALPGYEETEMPAIPDGWEFNTDAVPGDDVFPGTLLQPIVPIIEVPNLPESSMSISQGTEVWCLDGRWGIVDEVLVSGSGEVTAFVGRPDSIDELDRVIPLDLVQQADAGQVTLNCTLADISTYTQEVSDDHSEPEV